MFRRSTSTTSACRTCTAQDATPRSDSMTVKNAFPRGTLAADIWHARGIAARERHDTPASISAFETALALRDADDLRGQLNEVTSLSERHLNRGEYRHALVLQARAYELALALGDAAVLANVGTTLAGQLMTVGDYAGAERALGDSPERMKPDDPGGLKVPYQNETIYREVGPKSERVREPAGAERLLPPPEQPLPKPKPAEPLLRGRYPSEVRC